MADPVPTTLDAVTAALPGGGESRPGQTEMAEAVGRALATRRHLVVQAGTGTGKSLAYLVPAALGEGKVVVATATKALQDQLADKDLPLVAAALESELSYAVLKGRSNYLCVQRASEVRGTGQQLSMADGAADPPDADDPLGGRAEREQLDTGRLGDQVRRLLDWATETPTGDRAELDFEPHPKAWALVSTTARECPGAFRCPSGGECFAEEARSRAADADVVVVNTHLYGAHLASGGVVLPEHDVVVFDEAHEVEQVMTDSLGVDVGPGRFRALAVGAKAVLAAGGPGGTQVTTDLDHLAEVGDRWERALGPLAGTRVPEGALAAGGATPTELGALVELAVGRVDRLVSLVRQAERDAPPTEPPADKTRRDRLLLAAGHLADDLAHLRAAGEDEVVWVEDRPRAPALRVSPIDVAPLLSERLWGEATAVLTSATVPIGLVERLGLPGDGTDQLDVGSPFDYRAHALLYVAKSLPDRRRPEAEPAIHRELETLITAAGGRTLALFTSWRAMRAAAEALADRLPYRLFTQADLPKPALVEAFRADESSCLFATLGFWQGVDLPGPTLTLVTIDRIPFPRPDDPVLQARRDRAGGRAFAEVDLPRAGTLLAQGAGRLIRTAEDRGVVAVLDSRLATASYRRDLLARVPPMRRTLDRDEVAEFLAGAAAGR